MAFPLAISLHSIRLSCPPIFLVRIFMLTQSIHTLPKNFVSVGSPAPSLKGNSSTRLDLSNHHHCRLLQKKVLLASWPSTAYADISHTKEKLNPPLTMRSIQTTIPHAGGKQLMSLILYVTLTSHSLLLHLAWCFISLGYLLHIILTCSPLLSYCVLLSYSLLLHLWSPYHIISILTMIIIIFSSLISQRKLFA